MTKVKQNFFDRDTLLHLRLLFSLFLFPVFCFAISQATRVDWMKTVVVFIALHFFIYPGSNTYNSYMDNDKGSIGGLKNPPPATVKLFYISILLDVIGLLTCLLVSWRLVLLMMVYIVVSKAYSWKGVRLKKYGFTGWLVVMIFQGGYTFLVASMAAENLFAKQWFTAKNMESFALASLLIGGFYPLTQIYQHEEDSRRGDFTISYKLGITGTFIFSGILFLTATAVAWNYFNNFYSATHFSVFIFSLLPVMIYYAHWFAKAIRNKDCADYSHSMRINFVSSCCMIVCFTIIFFLNL
jgi:1,4-dihydroxy-2-naphthoate octaprenyltransferase